MTAAAAAAVAAAAAAATVATATAAIRACLRCTNLGWIGVGQGKGLIIVLKPSNITIQGQPSQRKVAKKYCSSSRLEICYILCFIFIFDLIVPWVGRPCLR